MEKGIWSLPLVQIDCKIFFHVIKITQRNSGVLFKNDSYEQETKIRYQTLHYIKSIQLVAGANLQQSDYGNETRSLSNNFDYKTRIDFIKIWIFLSRVNENFMMKISAFHSVLELMRILFQRLKYER